MPNIKVQIANKRATVEGSPVIICGNSDYTVTFTFDAEWSLTGVRTARFVYVKNGTVQHEDKPFEGNTVEVPVLSNITSVSVGVFAGDLCTTTPARIACQASILCGSGEVHEPSPDVYHQIMALFNSMAGQGAFGATEAQAQQIAQNTADIEVVEAIAKGKNRARVFRTTEDMDAWLKDANNKGVAVIGDNLYIEALEVPDWWIAKVLEAPNADGRYYEIAQLETQKVDLTPINAELAALRAECAENEESIAAAREDFEDEVRRTTSPTLTNSHVGGIKLIGVHGKSEQKQYIGKNLFDKDNADLKAWYLNGTTVGAVSTNLSFVFPCEASTTYTISKLTTTRCRVGCFESYPTVGSGYVSVANESTSNTGATFTTTSTAKYIVVQYMDDANETYTSEQILESLQLELGDTATDLEPYVGGKPSPSMEYQQNTKPVVVSEIKSVGKNFAKLVPTNLANRYNYSEYNANKIVATKLTETPDFIASFEADLVQGESYIISSVGSYDFAVYVYVDRLWGTLAMPSAIASNQKFTFTAESGTYIFGFYGNGTSGTTFTLENVMIRKADIVDATYEPYTESVVKLSKPITLNGIGESADELLSGTKRFKTVEFTGNEHWGRTTNDPNPCFLITLAAKRKAQALCSHFRHQDYPYTSGFASVTGIFGWDSAFSTLYFASALETVDQWKAYLAEQYANGTPVTLTYELAEPITEALPEVDQIALHGLKSFNGVTHISTDSEVEATIEMLYGTSRAGALTVQTSELQAVNDILLRGINAALPFAIVIDDDAKTINFIDR